MQLHELQALAASFHAGETDKAGRPITEHLERVRQRVVARGGDSIDQEAALFHDSLETGRTAQYLLDAGVHPLAVKIVSMLTRQAGQTYREYIRELKRDERCRLLKIDDVSDNSDPSRLALLDPGVAVSLAKRYDMALKILTGVEN